MNHPLVLISTCFATGIFAGSRLTVPPGIVYVLAAILLLFGVLLFNRRVGFTLAVLAFSFALGMSHMLGARKLPAQHISRLIYNYGNIYIVKGVVSSDPVYKDKRAAFIMKAAVIESAKFKMACCGDIMVYAKNRDGLIYGQELIARGKFSRTNRGDYLDRQGVLLILRVSSPADVVSLGKNSGSVIKRISLRIKSKMQALIARHTSKLTASIIQAMVLGEKRDIPWFVSQAMMQAGTIHILVVSGFNVGIVAYLIILCLKVARVPKKIRIVLAMPLVILYCFVTGASVPVARATIMALVFMVGALLRREPDIYNSLSIAVLLVLLMNPRQLFDIGFQLSFTSVICIIWL
jgi:competence protein ComEC